ncbi:protein WHAT'S THIS FACTOR 9, mitochondrial [Rutidosis leptorrhynchoides]|uniref:protein WHAT'S THIS FACTOR 9, mitochondrial n=1 Tax=Rutidosis leptorrhynchoides TaxID=125765 RepID=UPI003A98FA18
MQRQLVLEYLRRPSRRRYHTFNDINWVRDRALDHAVEKERDLKPMINIKNLIINSEPSKSLPISIISDNKSSLCIPSSARPIEFIRKYPSIFEEFFPSGGLRIHPHIKLTPETLTLDSEERILFENEVNKQDVADRLLKLLMLGRVNRIPLSVIDKLKWDLGLPNDYIQSIVPNFPDYFQVTSDGNELELVCWSDDLAVSVMEKSGKNAFSVQYSRGFEVDNKFKKWVDDWQKLPYMSPYEYVSKDNDESDKWIVGLMHEVLNLLVPKKTEKDNLLFLGEYLGVRSRFKRALLQHPGIFYVSSKLRTHTVVLREAYKRDLLVLKPVHPLMTLRSSYIHLMNVVKAKSKEKKVQQDQDSNKGEDEDDSDTASEREEDEDEDEDDDVDDEIEDEDAADSDSNNEDVVRMKEIDNFEGRNMNRTMKVNKKDSPRRNTPNARSSENDGRRRGREKSSKNSVDRKSDLRTKRTSNRRDERETSSRISLRTESPGARKAFRRS